MAIAYTSGRILKKQHDFYIESNSAVIAEMDLARQIDPGDIYPGEAFSVALTITNKRAHNAYAFITREMT